MSSPESKKMTTCSVLSPFGGQGKTTIVLLTARILEQRGYNVLVVDGNPQSDLSRLLGVIPGRKDDTLLDLIRYDDLAPMEVMYPVEGHANMRVIPATSKLSEANQYLASLGMGARVLRMRLESIADIFDVCLIDAPQQDSQLTLTTMGAADYLIMPAEANVKGYQALARALEMYADQQKLGGTQAQLLGVVPFRDVWVGYNRTKDCQKWITAMEGLLDGQKELMLPSIRQSEVIKRAITYQTALEEEDNLRFPFDQIVEKLVNPSAVPQSTPVASN